MRSATYIGLLIAVVLATSTARAQFAPQTWSADQDGQNFICADVGYFQANNLAGTGTRCAEVDPTGKIIPMSVACGTVTSVSGTNGVACTGSASVTCTVATSSCASNSFVSSASSSSGLVCTQPSFANLSGTAACSQLPLDGVSLVCGGGFASVGTVQAANIAAAAGGIGYFDVSSELASDPTNFGWNDSTRIMSIGTTTAPSAPGSGVLACWADSTGLDLTCKNTGGTVTHGVQTQSGAAHNFATSISAAGAVGIAQPAFSDLSGSQTCAQTPAFTGQSTKPAGSCVTTNVALTDGASQAWTFGTWADGEFARFDVGGGKFVAASTIAGDGTTVSTSNTGIPPENLTIKAKGLIDNAGSGAAHTTIGTWSASSLITTDSSGNIQGTVLRSTVLTNSSSLHFAFSGGGSGNTGYLIQFDSTNLSNTFTEYPTSTSPGSGNAEMFVDILANTLTGANQISLQITRDGGTNVGSPIVVTGGSGTGNVNTGVLASTGTNYGIKAVCGSGGTGSATITVELRTWGTL